MVLVSMNKMKKYYGDRLILDIDKLEILEGEKVGLVGVNGAGKTTLIEVLRGEVEVEEGKIYLHDSYGYVSQEEDSGIRCNSSKVKKLINSPEKSAGYLSGGEKVRLRIARALQEEKKILIADEPTSNLDEKSISILEDMLKIYKGALLLVSHDRRFLDNLCKKIIEINEGKISVYNGNYSRYLKLKEEEKRRKSFEYEQYILERDRLEAAKSQKVSLRNSIKKAPKRMGNSEARLHKMGDQRSKKNIEGNIKGIESRINKLEKKEKPKEVRGFKISIQDGMEIISKNLLEVSNLTIAVREKLLLDDISFTVKRNRKIALVGENGSGKTTLIKEIIKNSNRAIKINPRVKIGYFDQSQEILDKEKSILDNIKNTSSFNETFIRINLNLFGFKGDDVYKRVKVLSGGEKVKVALCKIILEDNNLLILDEPTNYLDIVSLGGLEEALKSTEKTMIIVSHDREFIDKVCDYIIKINNRSIEEFDGTYIDYIDNNKKVKNINEKRNEEILVLENKLSELISKLSLEKDEKKKLEYEKEYDYILIKLKDIRGR